MVTGKIGYTTTKCQSVVHRHIGVHYQLHAPFGYGNGNGGRLSPLGWSGNLACTNGNSDYAMPHIIIDYSANLESHVDFNAFCDRLRGAAAEIEIFEMAGIRVRAIRADHYSIADGNPEHGYVDICVRLREGRPIAARRDAAAMLFTAARDFLQHVLDSRPVALSLEMRNIDATLSPKVGTIRNYLGGS